MAMKSTPESVIDIVDVHDVGVVQRGGCFGLLYKAPLALGVRDPLGRLGP